MQKLKIVWLCHFSNQEMKNHFGALDVQSFAPWISELILLFRSHTEIELHIIAPNVFTPIDTCFFKNNVYYHFYKKKDIRNSLTRFITNGYLTNFYYIKRKIKKLIKQIKPDIIHLHGTENPYYSAGILPIIDKYPILVTVQGFARREPLHGIFHTIRCNVEKQILQKTNHFGFRADFLINYLRGFNKNAKFYHHFYPINQNVKTFNSNLKVKKKFDVVFSGRISKGKGIEDLIMSAALLKKEKYSINILVIGWLNNDYKVVLDKLIQENDLKFNVIFYPYQNTQEELFASISSAKLSVLPTYADVFPFTISESMFLKVPVISYEIEGVIDFNRSGKNIYLVKKGNIKELARAIRHLLLNIKAREEQAERAYAFVSSVFDGEEIYENLVRTYLLIKNEYQIE